MIQTFVEEAEIQRICLEHMWSDVYSHLWWTEMLRNPGTLPRIAPDDIIGILDNRGGLGTLDFSAQRSEMTRYQAAHESLVKEIEAAGVTGIWYDGDRQPGGV